MSANSKTSWRKGLRMLIQGQEILQSKRIGLIHVAVLKTRNER